MNTSDRFLRLAAECEVMARFSRTPETRAVWSGLAQRWVRCAKLVDQRLKRPRPSLSEAPSEGQSTVRRTDQVQTGPLGNF